LLLFLLACDPDGGSLDFAFLIDNTAGVSAGEWSQMQSFMTSFVQRLSRPAGSGTTQFAIVKFSDSSLSSTFQLTADRPAMYNAINGLTQSIVARNPATAINVLRDVFSTPANRATAPNVVIVVTSGAPSGSTDQTSAAARAAKEAGVQMLVVSVGSLVGALELSAIAISSHIYSYTYYTVPGFPELASNDVVNMLATRICSFHRLYLCKCNVVSSSISSLNNSVQ